jgi:hypothetical protein
MVTVLETSKITEQNNWMCNNNKRMQLCVTVLSKSEQILNIALIIIVANIINILKTNMFNVTCSFTSNQINLFRLELP